MNHLVKPDLFDSKRILCVQPHPDDTDIAFGATIALLCDRGVEVVYASVTDDAAGLSGEDAALPYEDRVALRRREQRSAAARLGVREVIELGFPDAGDWNEHEARDRIVDVIREVSPDTLLAVDPWARYEAHGDHRKAGYAAAEAAILHGFSAVGSNSPRATGKYSPTYSLERVGFFFTEQPNVIIDAESGKERKRAALADHASQWDAAGLDELYAYDEWRGARYGRRLSVPYAEGVLLVPVSWLHVFPDLVAVAAELE